MTLGKCLETLRWNTANKANLRVVPFRESKITKLFQNYFAGKGSLRMIININMCLHNVDETHQVLKFSALARQVTVVPQAVAIQIELPSDIWEQSVERQQLLADMQKLLTEAGSPF